MSIIGDLIQELIDDLAEGQELRDQQTPPKLDGEPKAAFVALIGGIVENANAALNDSRYYGIEGGLIPDSGGSILDHLHTCADWLSDNFPTNDKGSESNRFYTISQRTGAVIAEVCEM